MPAVPPRSSPTVRTASISNMLSSCRIASSLSNGIWQGSGGLSNFVTLGQHGSVEMLGLLTGVSGICTLLVAIPSGMASDRWRRDGVLRMFGVVENSERSRIVALMPLRPHTAESSYS